MLSTGNLYAMLYNVLGKRFSAAVSRQMKSCAEPLNQLCSDTVLSNKRAWKPVLLDLTRDILRPTEIPFCACVEANQ